jgi:hypothetical protein
MPTAKKPITVIMMIDKETPGTVRYKEIPVSGKTSKFGTFYIPKATLEELENPEVIEITVRKVE